MNALPPRPSRLRFWQIVRAAILMVIHPSLGRADSDVTLLRVPDGGIQPQVASDKTGTLHLLYFKGAPAAGDLFYARRTPEDTGFGRSIRVNGRPASAMAIGTIRGGQLAVGKDGRVHVAWNGLPPKGGTYLQAPMLYTRLNDAGTAFEPERDVITKARGLDGGGSVAADGLGNVYVTWHAPKPGNTEGEVGRAVFVARSRDGGRSFEPEALATREPTGACACCGMKAFTARNGDLFLSYRGASMSGNRDQLLLAAKEGEPDFELVLRHPWKVGACPMSSTSFGSLGEAVLAAWETAGQVYWTRFGPSGPSHTPPVVPPTLGTNPKHPRIVGNSQGEILLVWTEDSSWAKGGSVAWQRFDNSGKPVGAPGHTPGLPTWSFATVATTTHDNFIIIY